MNGLSWLIYLANIGSNVSGFLLFAGGVAGILLAGCIIARFVTAIVSSDEATNDATVANKFWEIIRPWFRTIIIVFFVLQIGARTIPDRQTVLLIAASEIGQRMLESKEVKDVVNPSVELLTTWMKKETMGLQEEIAKQAKDAIEKGKSAAKEKAKDLIEKSK